MIDQDTLSRLGNNPERGIPLVINEIENAWFDGLKQLNSKTHPAILAIDLIVGTAHGFHNQLADTCSQLFKEHARNLMTLVDTCRIKNVMGCLLTQVVLCFVLV